MFAGILIIWDNDSTWAVRQCYHSLIRLPALLLSSSHYYDIISCLSTILLSGSLNVRYSSVAEITHTHTHKKQCRCTVFQKDNYIISAWRASRKVIIRQVFLPIKVSSLVCVFFLLCDTELSAVPCDMWQDYSVIVKFIIISTCSKCSLRLCLLEAVRFLKTWVE